MKTPAQQELLKKIRRELLELSWDCLQIEAGSKGEARAWAAVANRLKSIAKNISP